MSRRSVCLALLLALSAFTPAKAQNAEAGKAVFRQVCAVCHAATPGRTLIGPTLFGVVGRKSGAVPGYQYSDANKKAGITWTPEELDKYLEAPRQVVPGTKMTYAGMKDTQKRHDLIAYLETLH